MSSELPARFDAGCVRVGQGSLVGAAVQRFAPSYAAMDRLSAEFVDAVAAGLGGHPVQMQQLLGRALRQPPPAIQTDPALLQGLMTAVASITAPEGTAAIRSAQVRRWSSGQTMSASRSSDRGHQFEDLPDSLVLDDVTAAVPALAEDVGADILAIIDEHHSESLRELGVPPTRTVLLTGEPGTGKTMTARWIAGQLRRPLLRLDLAAVMNKQLGRSAQNLVEALDYAAAAEAILFIDEFDAVGSARTSSTDIGEVRRFVNVLLLALDQWPDGGLLIGATNHPQLLDTAVHRRFETSVCLNKPDQAARQCIWKSALTAIAADDAALLAELSAGWSGSDIATCALRIRRSAALQKRLPNVDDALKVLARCGVGEPAT